MDGWWMDGGKEGRTDGRIDRTTREKLGKETIVIMSQPWQIY